MEKKPNNPEDQLSDRVTRELKESSVGKTVTVDTVGNVTYGLFVGSALDYWSGLNLPGILMSRLYATGMNSATGGIYGFWRELACWATRTTKGSGIVRKTLTDLLAFNTFQVPIYTSAVAVGSLISEGKVNWEKVADGAQNIATISPLIAPTLGWYMNLVRKVCGVKSAAQGAYLKRDADAA